jgi:ferric-chelate reductase
MRLSSELEVILSAVRSLLTSRSHSEPMRWPLLLPAVASTYLPVTHRDYESDPLAAEQVFVIRVHAGITRKLYETVLQGGEEEDEDDTSQLRPRKGGQFASMPLFPAFLEGPYGHDPLAHHYESVVLFVGGSGVSFAVPILLDLVRRARNRELGGSKPMVTTRVTWVWTIQEEG